MPLGRILSSSASSRPICLNLVILLCLFREVIVQGSVRWPNGLALDLVLDRS